ncbi:FtsX-like permease family protein [bacterium]|nr:FtsX-like permease family protein [bacterium]
MFKNYIKIAFRTLRKHKLYSLINIFGLTLGISCCILIYLFIQNEFSYDKFHDNAENIYRIEEINYYAPKASIEPNPFFDTRSPENVRKSPWLPMPLGPALKDRIPEIEKYSRFDQNSYIVASVNQSFEEEISFVESNFFEVFSFPLIQGAPESVLSEPNDMVITPQIADKYFGDVDPIGKTLTLLLSNTEHIFTVKGIAEPSPANSSIQYSVVVRIENKPGYERNMSRWNSFNTPLFVQLSPTANITEFEKKLNQFAEERWSEDWPEDRARRGLPEDATVFEFEASKITKIHLDAGAEWFGVSNPMYSYILGMIAVLILIIACINYVTLTLSRSSSRVKEVGVRKSSGALRNQIAIQFWSETQLLTVFAMIAGIGLAELALPFFNELSGKNLAINYAENAGFLGYLLGITLLTGLIAGSYPAIILSSFEPVKVLKGLNSFQFKPRLIKGLLVVQYSLSIFLIISSVIMFQQLDFVSSKDLGYNQEQVVFINTHKGWSEEGTALMQLYREQLNGVPAIELVSGMTPSFTRGSNRYGFEIDGENKRSYIYYIDDKIVPTLGFELTQGRNLSIERPADINNSIVINEAFVAEMGWEDPIGKLVPWKGEDNPSTVVGVVKDFHFQSLEVEIEPMLFHMDPEQGGIADIAVRIKPGMISEALPELKKVWADVSPGIPFDYWFLDDAVANQYQEYKRWLSIMSASTFIAILIACMGLFALASLTASTRIKEIGIRKVLGAGVDQIIYLLNKDVLKLIFVSIVIATPVSWLIMDKWLSDFAYRISINFGVFGISAIVTLTIAMLSVSYHSIKAALSNPVESLKSE